MGDISRRTHDPSKHYSGVLEQQGKVLLDAEWNEQLAIQHHRTETETRDVVGVCGAPKAANGFKITSTPDGQDLIISAGHIYVNGLLCELEASAIRIESFPTSKQAQIAHLLLDRKPLEVGAWVEVFDPAQSTSKLVKITQIDVDQAVLTFDNDLGGIQNSSKAYLRRLTTVQSQPDFSTTLPAGLTSPPTSPPSALPQLFLIYIEAWQREITALDDPAIREVALGGPDTTTRLKTVWQVKLLPVSSIASPPASPPDPCCACDTQFKEWTDLVSGCAGKLSAQTKPPKDQKDPCLLPPGAGYRGLENQLYRVQIHNGNPNPLSFKWSSNNASVRTRIEEIDGKNLVVSEIGKDEVLCFAPGQWVEITDEDSILNRTPNKLVQIDKVEPEVRKIIVKDSQDALKTCKNLQLVRWDQNSNPVLQDGVPITSGWIDLEAGIQVKFSDSSYCSGDYWLIPARTATGNIEWPYEEISTGIRPIDLPPVGTKHHYCRLALIEISPSGKIDIKDCRHLFPPLSHICAEDVCFDNTKCTLPGTKTVQDALDRLCAERDLRHHNKYLHGWGIVCGLQVFCGPDPQGTERRHVTVKPGYAIDCEGNDVLLKSAEPLDLINLIQQQLGSTMSLPASPPQDLLTDGEVCLGLKLDECQRISYFLEKYDPAKDRKKSPLDGTIWMDFYNDCVKPPLDFIKDEFQPDPEEGKLPVGPTAKRTTTLLNLLIQLFNPVNGKFVFLSGERNETGKNLEDTILRNFYLKLREKLKSHTFCAMFDGARQFPDYPYSQTGMQTIFGKGFQKRLRIHPKGVLAYSVGAGNKINVYDLKKGEMVEELEFPGGAGYLVQDVAFSPKGNQLYAVATIKGKDTAFAIADISGVNHKWHDPSIICDVLLMTLAVWKERVLATGRGKGLYFINPDNVNATPSPNFTFNAVSHMILDAERGLAFCSANDNITGATDTYDRIAVLDLSKEKGLPLAVFDLAKRTGTDDIAVLFQGNELRLYAVIDPAAGETTKRLRVIRTEDLNVTSARTVDLGENTAVRMAFNPITKLMMVTFEDSYRIAALNEDDHLFTEFRHPVQISPLSIAFNAASKRVYVLNFGSNTLSSIPAKLIHPENQISLKDLVEYRTGVLNAFTDLFAGLLQYLKDCFCDHLLVNCPTCDEDDKIYLACIRIKNQQVYKICNFSRRKYVKSFPTVEYWLSIVPILPLVDKAVEAFCCSILPDFFAKYDAKKNIDSNFFAISKNQISSNAIRKLTTLAQNTNLRSEFSSSLRRLSAFKKFATDYADTRTSEIVSQRPIVKQSDLANRPVAEARMQLEEAGVTVAGVEHYDRGLLMRNASRLNRAPARLTAGSNVNLVVDDNNNVVFYAPAEETPDHVRELESAVLKNKESISETKTAATEEASRLREEVTALKNELVQARKAQQEAQQAHESDLKGIRQQIKKLSQPAPEKPPKPK